MKRIVKSFFLVFLSFTLLFVATNRFVASPENAIEPVEGASIRKKTEQSDQGLRFYAKLDKAYADNEHGFFLVYGETSVAELSAAISEANGNKVMLNGKEVFKVVVNGIDKNNQFSVVLTGIPDSGYFDELSAIAYVVIGNQTRFVNPISRSIANVAFRLANEGEDIQDIVSFDKMLQTNRKRVHRNSKGDIEIVESVFEADPKILKEEFIKDWNKLFKTDLGDFDAATFAQYAAAGSPNSNPNDNKNLAMTNLYEFFNNRKNVVKWEWLLDYMIDKCTLVHPGNQARAIRGDGTYGDFPLYNCMHLSYSIANFFNQKADAHSNYSAIDFKEGSLYDDIVDFNNGVFVNLGRSKLYKEGEKIWLPAPKDRPGYVFKHYQNGSKTYNPGDEYVVGSRERLEAKFSPSNYPVKFNDGSNEMANLKDTYNIETELVLPTPEKEGFKFLGWYENANLQGNKVTKINKGQTGEKTFYAKWEKLPDPGPTDEELVLAAKDALNLSFASGDSANSVTKNITLPSKGLHDTVITWDSSNTNAVSVAGVVTRQTADANVKLTATIKLNEASTTKEFNIKVVKKEIPVDPNQEFTITFHLNGGAWPTTTVGSGTYANRDEMIVDFLTDFHTFLKPAGVSLSDFMHGAGKTSGFDGTYNDYIDDLRALNKDKTVNPGTGKFVNQAAYNKWVALLDLINEFTNINVDQTDQFWTSNWVGGPRLKQFITKTNPWGAWAQESMDALINVIPESLKGSGGGTQVPIDYPKKYKPSSNDIALPAPEKSGDAFKGWYDNADFAGNPVTKIAKGSSGNKVFYARYASTVLPEPDLTDAEKMALAKAAVKVGYSSGDSASSVTKKLTLATTGLHGATISWASSNTAVINAAGNVVRAKDDAVVTLTATIKLGSLTEVVEFKVTVKKVEPEPDFYTVELVLNGGAFVVEGFKNKTELLNALLTDFRSFLGATDAVATFRHGAGKTSGFAGTWFSNEDYRNKFYGANIKSGNNNYFLSHSTYGPKWKPFADMMVQFVKVGNPEQDFWTSPYTGMLRMSQYASNTKPGGAWDDDDMAMMPKGMSATVIPDKFTKDSETITLPQATKAGYEFEGWYTANTGGSKVTSIPKGSTGNKKFYARWGEITRFTITYNLNGGKFSGYTSVKGVADGFLKDLHAFVNPSDNLTTFMHGAGKTSGYNGTWFTNDDYKAKIYSANTKSGNNNFFFSSGSYQAKWKPLADFMVAFVKVGNPDQDFWASPYTGVIRMQQYFSGTKPGGAWDDAEMKKLPSGLAANVYYEYDVNSPAITLPTPTRSNFEFVGWYTANTGGSKVTSIAKGSTGNKTFYARWKEVANPKLNAMMQLFTDNHRSSITKNSITYYGATNHAKTLYPFVNRFLFTEALTITNRYLSTARGNHSNRVVNNISWITIHDTANTNASALANHQYMQNGAGGATVSWHYTTGNDGIFKAFANDATVAWHAGDGSTRTSFRDTGIKATNPYLRPKLGVSNGNYTVNGVRTGIKASGTNFNTLGQWAVIRNGTYQINTTRMASSQTWTPVVAMNGGNYDSIGIETSVLRTDDIWWTWHKTSKLVAKLLVDNGLLPDRVAFHNNFDGKECPKTAMRSSNINEWLKMIDMEYKIRKDYSGYKVAFTSHSSALNNRGRIISYPTSTTNMSYTVTLTDPNGVSISKKFTTSVRV